jgi:hypothetical protein
MASDIGITPDVRAPAPNDSQSVLRISPRRFRAGQLGSENHALVRVNGTAYNQEIIIVEVVPPPYQHGRGTDRGNQARRGIGIQSRGPQLLHDSLNANVENLLKGAGE